MFLGLPSSQFRVFFASKMKSEVKGNNRLIVSFLFTFQENVTKSYKSTCVQIFATPIHHFFHFLSILPSVGSLGRHSRELCRKGSYVAFSAFFLFESRDPSKPGSLLRSDQKIFCSLFSEEKFSFFQFSPFSAS